MRSRIRFCHVNLVADDWRSLADFYIKVFRFKPLGPERDLSGSWVSRLTGLDNATIKGVHLRFPGEKNQMITLEIFEYKPKSATVAEKQINRSGLGHIAFIVEDFEGMISMIVENGGAYYNQPVCASIEGVGLMHVVYMKDPEGNIIELQKMQT